MICRSALQRKQEVFRNVLGFVNLNGRPQLPSVSGGTSLGAPPIPPFFSPFPRPEATVDLYERTRYLQPSCMMNEISRPVHNIDFIPVLRFH